MTISLHSLRFELWNFDFVIGSLEFAALESVPPDLVDNAAILGTISLVTAALFLLDLGSPKAKKPQHKVQIIPKPKTQEPRRLEMFEIESEIEKRKKPAVESAPEQIELDPKKMQEQPKYNGQNGYSKMAEEQIKLEKPKEVSRFGIYGKDVEDDKDSDDLFDDSSSKTELHSPVWSNIRKGMWLW